jgi:hypothetical protein
MSKGGLFWSEDVEKLKGLILCRLVFSETLLPWLGAVALQVLKNLGRHGR